MVVMSAARKRLAGGLANDQLSLYEVFVGFSIVCLLLRVFTHPIVNIVSWSGIGDPRSYLATCDHYALLTEHMRPRVVTLALFWRFSTEVQRS